MRFATLLGILLFMLLPAATQAEEPIPPQARPIVNWLKAVKENDVALLKTVFSQKKVEDFEQRGWEKVMQIYQREFPKQFGSLDPADFTFTYQGKETAGEVEVATKEKKLGKLRVVLEEQEWKVNEN